MASLYDAHIRSVFITGTSRGIGLEFVKQLSELSEPPTHIFATCRSPDTATDLKELAKKNANIHVLKLDVLNFESYAAVMERVEQILDIDEGLNVLINNAAIKQHEFQELDVVTHKAMMTEFETNCVAPLMLTKALLPLLKKAASKYGGSGLSCSRASVINISSRMGSVDDNTSGGNYPYRTSKTALNMTTKSLSVDLKPHGILAVALHPGWAQTNMGGPDALISTETSVKGLINVIEHLKNENAGCFISFKNEVIPW